MNSITDDDVLPIEEQTRESQNEEEEEDDDDDDDDSVIETGQLEKEVETGALHPTSQEGVDDESYTLNSDIFSLMFVCRTLSSGFLYAATIFLIQLFILGLATYNLLRDPPAGNTFKIPVWTDTEEVLAQGCAILVTLVVNKELSDSFDIFQVKYDSKKLAAQNQPHVTKGKWIFSHLSRFGVGTTTLLVTFLVIIQSTDVLDMFQNFTALAFVGELDVVGFYLAEKGLVTCNMKGSVEKVKSVRMDRKGKTKIRISGITFLITSLTMFGLWFWVRLLQLDGYFFSLECTDFQINFEDHSFDFFDFVCRQGENQCPDGWTERTDPIRYLSFSDVYVAARKQNGRPQLENNRPVFYQRDKKNFGEDPNDPSPAGKISYSRKEQAWIFTLDGVQKIDNPDASSWLMKSPVTDSFLLNDVSESDWNTWTGILTEAVVDITCVQCSGAPLVNIVDCTYHGYCKNERCSCSKHFMGAQCETCTACTDFRFKSSNGDGDSYMANTIPGDMLRLAGVDELRPFNTYGRPVYYHGSIDKTTGVKTMRSDPLVLLLFTGGEYWIWNIGLEEVGGVASEEAVRSYLETFHSVWDFKENRRPWYESEATLNPMPRGLTWFNFTSREVVDIDVQCDNANETAVCAFLGYDE